VEWARHAYGVVIDAKGTVDKTETQQTRAAIRDERRRASGLSNQDIPAVTPWTPSPEAIRVSEAVYCERADGKLRLRCRCGCVLGSANKSPKIYAAMSRLPVQSIGPEVNPFSVNGARFELREFYCPACVTRLEVEIARPGDPVLDDSCVSPDWIAKKIASPAQPRQGSKGSR
jgi:acetone carboxylase gamma subunit